MGGGEMDVVCVARQVFKLLTFEPQMEGKLYAGGLVELLEYDFKASDGLKELVMDHLMELYRIMEVPYGAITLDSFTSFSLAHKMGLSFEQEYALLQIPSERERLLFIKDHLDTTIQVLQQVNRTRKTIELNGHFKNFDPLDFTDMEI
jgi:uncharacterized protein